MSQAFVVEVTEKPAVTPPESLESLAKAFRIEPRKVELMLRRLPGVATKPISQQEATVVVTYFEQAGLKANLKSVTPVLVVAETISTAEATKPERFEASSVKEEVQADLSVNESVNEEETSHQEVSLSDLDSPPIELEPLNSSPLRPSLLLLKNQSLLKKILVKSLSF